MILFLIIAAVSLFFSIFVFFQDRHSQLNRYYLTFTVFINVWLSGTLLEKTPENLFELHFRMLFPVAMVMSYFLMLFAAEVSQHRIASFKKLIFLTLAGIITYLSLGSGLITETVARSSDGIDVTRGVLYVPAALTVASGGFIAVWLITRRLRDNSLDSKQKLRLKLVGRTLLLAVLVATVSNVILPVLTGSTGYSNFAPLALLVLSFGLGYAIWKHGLFNFRARVLISLAYTSALFVLACIFIATSYAVTSVVGAKDISIELRIYFVLASVLTGILFNPLRIFFNKLTNRFFYRDSYEPQVVIDELNNALVVTADLETLLKKTASIIQSSMKSTSVTFYIRETSYFDARVVSTEDKIAIKNSDILEILEISPTIQRKMHSVDMDMVSESEKSLTKLLSKNGQQVMGRLVSTLDFQVKGIGLFFLGPKRSGGIYNKQDLKLLETIANELVIAIENVLRTEEIEQFNVTLQNKIDAATKELKDSNEKLRALDEAKDEFVSMASHQLRTPLTSIKGYLSMVLEGDAGKLTDTQKEMLGQAFFSSQRMVYLISDLLNVSRLKTGKFNIEQSPVNLAKIVEEEVSQLQEGAKAKNITLSYHAPKEFPELMLDDMKTRQVIMNFTDNAIYYTPDGGSIKLQVKNREKSVEFTVTDSGIGVPKDQQHKLFTKFFRADNARKARPDGTGLGLFMAKKVIVSQGGSIIFKSKEGKGSTFGFSFPKEQLKVVGKD